MILISLFFNKKNLINKLLKKMENKLLFISILIAAILIFLAIIVIIIFLMNKEEDWRDYDRYILSISWSPSVCFNEKEKRQECFDTLDKLNINKSLIINGLWPIYSSGKDMAKCNKEEDINVVFDEDNKEYFSKNWPGLNQSDNDKWNYEYNQYGYCYIQRNRKNVEKNYLSYFTQAKDLFENKSYSELIEHLLPYTTKGLHTVLKTKFQTFIKESGVPLDPSTYSLYCEKNKDEKDKFILKEIRIKYDLDFNLTSNFQLNDNCPERFDIYFRDENKQAVWDKYDYYVMTLFWPATYCIIHGKECYKKLKKRELNINTIHGLWPSYEQNDNLQWCNIDTDVEIDQHTSDMDYYWVNMDFKDNKDFWNHEYNKHGFCYNKRNGNSTNDYLIYFNKTFEVYRNIPTIQNGTINAKDLMKKYLYPGMFAGMNKLIIDDLRQRLKDIFGNGTFGFNCLKINGQYYLHEIRVYLEFNLSSLHIGHEIADCPHDFLAEFLEDEGEQKPAQKDFYKEYDMYFFTILWLGTTCHLKGPQCYDRLLPTVKNKFSLHGIWPNLRNGTIEQGFCNGPNDIEIDINNKTLLNFMNEHYISGYHTNEYFWGHEYNKHGYCYNQRVNHDVKDYEFFFQKVKDMFVENNFEDLFIDFFKKEGRQIIGGDLDINRTRFEAFLDERGISNDKYLIVCTNVTNQDINNPHILEMRIRYDLDFHLLKNETDKSEFDCPEIFYAQFFG